jgi:hypothetical protein
MYLVIDYYYTPTGCISLIDTSLPQFKRANSQQVFLVYTKRLSEKMTTMNASNFLKWTSIAIQMENPEYSKSDSMKLAILELKKEKLMRNYIRMVSTHIQKEKPGITKAASIKQAMAEWKAM